VRFAQDNHMVNPLVYGLAAIIDIGWPRAPDAAWYANYAVLLSTAVVVASGLLYMAIAKPQVAAPAW